MRTVGEDDCAEVRAAIKRVQMEMEILVTRVNIEHVTSKLSADSEESSHYQTFNKLTSSHD